MRLTLTVLVMLGAAVGASAATWHVPLLPHYSTVYLTNLTDEAATDVIIFAWDRRGWTRLKGHPAA